MQVHHSTVHTVLRLPEKRKKEETETATTRHLFSQLVFGNLISTARHSHTHFGSSTRQTQSNQLHDDNDAAAHFGVFFLRDKEGVYMFKTIPMTNGLLHNLVASIKASVFLSLRVGDARTRAVR